MLKYTIIRATQIVDSWGIRFCLIPSCTGLWICISLLYKEGYMAFPLLTLGTKLCFKQSMQTKHMLKVFYAKGVGFPGKIEN